MSPRPAALSIVAASLAIAFSAAGQAKDPVAAESLFRDARDATKRGDYATACPKFAESQRLDPAAGTLLNLADCEEHIGKLASAWQHFREAGEQLPVNDDRIGMAKDRAAALDKRIPRLTIRLDSAAPPGTKVFRDGVEMGAASLDTPLALEPGAHVIVARAPAGKEQTTKLTLKEGQSESLTLSVVDGPSDAGKSAPAPTGGGSSNATIGYVTGGVGAAGIVVSLVTGGLALGKKSTMQSGCDAQKYCTPDAIDAGNSGKTLSTVSTVAFAVGLVGLAAGAYFIISSKPSGATTALVPAGGANGGRLTFVSTF